jgi:hypothetical protein
MSRRPAQFRRIASPKSSFHLFGTATPPETIRHSPWPYSKNLFQPAHGQTNLSEKANSECRR